MEDKTIMVIEKGLLGTQGPRLVGYLELKGNYKGIYGSVYGSDESWVEIWKEIEGRRVLELQGEKYLGWHWYVDSHPENEDIVELESLSETGEASYLRLPKGSVYTEITEEDDLYE